MEISSIWINISRAFRNSFEVDEVKTRVQQPEIVSFSRFSVIGDNKRIKIVLFLFRNNWTMEIFERKISSIFFENIRSG